MVIDIGILKNNQITFLPYFFSLYLKQGLVFTVLSHGKNLRFRQRKRKGGRKVA